ncbi:unnamed protein product [Heterobilharzia americana]|nr:unnamed protein product [Heterobilharzia americana]
MFTTMDVYDAALSIGRECQLIVDQYNDDLLENLMPKIIYILEELEACTIYCDNEKKEIVHLQELADELREDQKSDLLLKDKYDQSLEQLERSWYCESEKLLKEINELEQENIRLTHHLISSCNKEVKEKEEQDNENYSNILNKYIKYNNDSGEYSKLYSKVDTFLLTKTKLNLGNISSNHEVDKTLDKLKNKSTEEELSNIMSSLLLETEERIQLTEQENRAADLQLIQQLKECVAINYKSARQIRRELAEVSASLDASEEEVCRLARQSGQLMASCAPHRRQTGQLVAEKATLEAQLCVKERALASLLGEMSSDEIAQIQGSGTSTDTYQSILHLSAGQGLESCPINSERPSYSEHISLEELRYLLHERNELKCRLIELEEEFNALESRTKRIQM